MKKVRIAIQSSGRLSQDSIKFLKSLGLKFAVKGRGLITPCKDGKTEIIFIRDDDIPQYVSHGVANFGIVGENVLYENLSDVKVVKKLDFGKCSLVIAVPKNSAIKKLADLSDERIATSYPSLLSRFLKKNGIKSAIIPIKGAVEITTSLNLADAVCDLTQSGRTLKENGLDILETVMKSRAVLIESPDNTEKL